jgi:hypothetical protein
MSRKDLRAADFKSLASLSKKSRETEHTTGYSRKSSMPLYDLNWAIESDFCVNATLLVSITQKRAEQQELLLPCLSTRRRYSL